MQKVKIAEKCAAIVPGWDVYINGICPPDGFGIFRFENIKSGAFGNSQMKEIWKFYSHALITETFFQINNLFNTGIYNHSFSIRENGILIFDRKNKVVYVSDFDEFIQEEKENALIKFFELEEI